MKSNERNKYEAHELRNVICLAAALATSQAWASVGTVSGPFRCRNLDIFLVHGETQLEEHRYATLSEGLSKGIVVVKETGNVQELTVSNNSKDVTVFVHAGDIVKGGRQDRTVKDDLILPPQSGSVPLSTFCVEQGRWTRRGQEDSAAFGANTKVLSSKQLKLAARYGANQSDVWSGVAEQQAKLNSNVSGLAGRSVDTRHSDSASSLQLTLENKELDDVKREYLRAFERLPNDKTDVIGFVYAINGELNSAEVYNNKALFRALWSKLLDAAITEAVAELKPSAEIRKLQPAEVATFFKTALSGDIKERSVWKSTVVRTYTSPGTILFETIDVGADNTWVHKSFIDKRETQQTVVPLDRQERSRSSR